MTRILLPTNFFEECRHVLKYILTRLQNSSVACQIVLLNTYLIPPSDPSQLIGVNDKLKQQSLAGLEKERNFAQQLVANGQITFEVLTQMGSLENVISNVVKQQNIDCLILGMCSNSKKAELLSFIDRIDCPVIIVPSQIIKGHYQELQ